VTSHVVATIVPRTVRAKPSPPQFECVRRHAGAGADTTVSERLAAAVWRVSVAVPWRSSARSDLTPNTSKACSPGPGGRARTSGFRGPKAPRVQEDLGTAAEERARSDGPALAEHLDFRDRGARRLAVASRLGARFHGEFDGVGGAQADRVGQVPVVANVVCAIVAELEDDQLVVARWFWNGVADRGRTCFGR